MFSCILLLILGLAKQSWWSKFEIKFIKIMKLLSLFNILDNANIKCNDSEWTNFVV